MTGSGYLAPRGVQFVFPNFFKNYTFFWKIASVKKYGKHLSAHNGNVECMEKIWCLHEIYKWTPKEQNTQQKKKKNNEKVKFSTQFN